MFLLIVFLFFLLVPKDTDLGWHLRYGQKIWQDGEIFRDNQIGFFLTNYDWVHAYSGYQALIYPIYKMFGFWGLAILGSLIMVMIFGILIKKFKTPILGWVVVMGFFTLMAWPVLAMGLRSQIFSLLGMNLLLWFLTGEKFMKKWWLYPLLMVFWVNLHGGFVLGLVIMGFFGVETWWRKKKINKVVLMGLSGFGTSLLNPFGGRIYEEVYRHSWYPLNELIAEWVEPRGLSMLLVFLVIVLDGLVLLTSLAKNKKIFLEKNKIFLFLSLLFFAYLAFRARRNLGFFGLVSVWWCFDLIKVKTKDHWWQNWLMVGLAVLMAVIVRQRWRGQGNSLRLSGVEMYLEENKVCKNVYNTYERGGQLEWSLPQYKFFVDGRMPAWPTGEEKSPYTVYLEIIQAREGWSERVINYGADCLFISKGTFLDLELREKGNPGWLLEFEDEKEALYRKTN